MEGVLGAAALAVYSLAGVLEYRRLCRTLERVPVRILVNGTRGKSSVTRLIAAGLRAGGMRVLAKTTGSAARLILPDGSEEAIRRKGQATIMEHAALARRAAREGAQALVAECMAVQPETTAVLTERLARPTIGVITNVRQDHDDTMGKSLEEVARVLSLSIPWAGDLFMGEEADGIRAILEHEAERRRTRIHVIKAIAEDDEICRQFAYPMFPENIALARAVCSLCGVGWSAAGEGMLGSSPDPGVLPVLDIEWKGMAIRVINAFAANESASTAMLWDRYHRAGGNGEGALSVVVYGHRTDRAWRAQALPAIAEHAGAMLVVSNALPLAVRRMLKKRGIPGSVCVLPKPDAQALLELVYGAHTTAGNAAVGIGDMGMGDGGLSAAFNILCIGNIKGWGEALSASFMKLVKQGKEL